MNIFIVPIEPIDSRYTKQWYENIPLLITHRAQELGVDVTVTTIDGDDIPENTTSGAFLNFGTTNYYKASQAQAVSKLFMDGLVNPGDKFLITDAWNFVITPIKYMSELLDIPVEIHSIWHAGAYDPSDILGMKMTQPWASNVERSWYYSSTFNYFGSDFHKHMFLKNLGITFQDHHLAVTSGQPYEHLAPLLTKYQKNTKSNVIMWPHRYNADKQPEIIEDLSTKFNTVITQKHNFSKSEYYDLLGSSKVVFSCSLHENLGVSMIEGTLAGAIPILPDRCCYSEMYMNIFKYPSEWTSSYENYTRHKKDLVAFIEKRMDNYEFYLPYLEQQRAILVAEYINSNIMLDRLLNVSR